MAVQGKCDKCKIRWKFPNRNIPLKYTFCPICGQWLERTSYKLSWPTRMGKWYRGRLVEKI